MKIDDLTIRQAKELARLFSADKVKIPTEEYVPVFKNPVVAQFIGRFVFVCNLQIIGNGIYVESPDDKIDDAG